MTGVQTCALPIYSLKATVYRHFGLEHHLHDFIDKNVTVIEGEFDSLSSDEIKTKIESVMKELEEAKSKLEAEETNEE